MKRYSLHVPADLSLASSIRKIAVRIFEEIGFRGSQVSRLKLVFDELYMNAVKYGSLENSTIYITFEFEEKILKVSLEDEGGEKKMTAEDLNEIINFQKTNKDPAKTSGRGLAQITHVWADDFQVRNGKRGGLCIMFSKKLVPEEEDEKSSGENEEVTGVESEITQGPREVPEGIPEKLVSIVGEVDNANLGEKTKPVDAFLQGVHSPFLLILNLGNMQFCNSTFIAKLAMWKQQLSAMNGDIVVENAKNEVWEIFKLVGITKLINISTGPYSRPVAQEAALIQ